MNALTLVMTIARRMVLVGLLLTTTGCGLLPRQRADAQPSQQERGGGTVAVETAIAQTGSLEAEQEYTGTTEPLQQVSLRSQVEGQLLRLNVNVGDAVNQGEVLAQIDDSLLTNDVNEARAELAARQSEVAQAITRVSEAQTRVEQARAEYQQARADAERLRQLASEGAIAQQQAELAQTSLRTTEQVLRAAQDQVRTQQQAVVAAQGRVTAQQAVVSQRQERRSFSALTSPISGLVLQRMTEVGNLVQPGNEILSLGDFSSVKVAVQISELVLSSIRLGQPVQVRLDAFPDRTFRGEVTRISPAADPTARLIPIEVTIPNDGGRIGSGLLARVNFTELAAQPILVPQSALELGQEEGGSPMIFVIDQTAEAATVVARQVQVGEQANGQVEIRSGLEPGEAFVVRSSRPLTPGQPVRLSILSET